jgi:hypothetical protein
LFLSKKSSKNAFFLLAFYLVLQIKRKVKNGNKTRLLPEKSFYKKLRTQERVKRIFFVVKLSAENYHSGLATF